MNLLAVGKALSERDSSTCGGDGGEACLLNDTGTRNIPSVNKNERLGGVVQSPQRLSLFFLL